MTFAFGSKEGEGQGMGEFWKTVFFPNLEDFDAAGLRLVGYNAWLDGATVALGRIYDIDNVSIIE